MTGQKILLSSEWNGLAGYEDHDVVLYDTATQTFAVYLDGEDVGITGDIDAVHSLPDGSTLISLNSTTSLPGVGTVNGEDIVRFVPTSIGATTSGTFEMYLDGSDVGLSGVNIDATTLTPDGRIIISLQSPGAVAGINVEDEDFVVFNSTSLGESTAGTWEWYLDGSDLNLGGGLDFNAAWIDAATGSLYLSNWHASFSITDVNAEWSDIVFGIPTSLGLESSGSFSMFFDGRDAGIGSQRVDAFSVLDETNQPPTIDLSNAVSSLPEDTDTTNRIEVAQLVITDDNLGINTLSLSGIDSGLFEIDGGSLYLLAGTALNAGLNPVLDVSVQVDDGSTFAKPDDVASLSISVTPVTPPLQQADVEISQTVSNATPLVGDQVTITLTATNHGPDGASGVGTLMSLPTGWQYESFSSSFGTYDNSTGTWQIGQLPNGATETLQLTARLSPMPGTPTGSGSYIDDIVPLSAGVNGPNFIVIGPDGHMYVSSQETNEVKRFDAGTGAFVDNFIPAGYGGLQSPNGLTFGPDGSLYVSSQGTNQVLRYDGTTGNFQGVFAVPHDTPQNGGLDLPGILVFGPDGNLYVSSIGFNPDDVHRYDGVSGAYIDRFVLEEDAGLHGPWGMAFGPDGNLYVNSFHTDEVLRFHGATGTFLDVFASGGGLQGPRGLTFGPDQDLYISSFFTDEVIRYDGVTGTFIEVFADTGLSGPRGLTFAPDGNLLVASHFNDRVVRFDGLLSTVARMSSSTVDPDITNNSSSIGIDYTLVDFGDAPSNLGYATQAAQNGARHGVADGAVALMLGASIDTESQAAANGDATGDDTLGVDDEDGILFTTAMVVGASASVQVTVTDTGTSGFLNGWVDFNQNGSWEDSGEQIIVDLPVAAVSGTQTITVSFTIPLSAQLGATFARFRLDSGGGLASTGVASDGEVEDTITPELEL